MKVSVVLALALGGSIVSGQPLGSLKTVIVPKPTNLGKYVRDEKALVALGKALFWDVQASSDGRVACASCHFHAGADHRAQNQLANRRGSFAPNYTLTLDDYPFRKLADITNNRSTVLRDSAQIAGSSGLFRRLFSDIIPNAAEEDGFDTSDTPAFSLGGINVRRATTRNTPSVINAVFYHRNFWDGRASNTFTGATPFGESDLRANARVVSNGQLVAEQVRVDNSSLASQAVGPALNDVEMSYEGRTWPKLGKKLLGLQPLALQRVAPDDSVLGAMANPEGRGLSPQYTYVTLIQAAFHPEYWSSTSLVDAGGALLAARLEGASNTSEFTQAEWNFSIFWGLAVQAYQATLVSDDSRFDRFWDGDGDALNPLEQRGLNLFRGRGECTDCHAGPEFTTASFDNVTRQGGVQGRGNGAFRDRGFFRIGVRPIEEDLGVGGKDDFGQPLSLSVAQNASAQNSINGTFKAPTLRNVEFTGPYFHNGGQATLEQVVQFYSRGGDFPDDGNLGPGIGRRNFDADERAALVAFLKSLSDDRVRYEQAPFDHPELCIPVGQAEIRPSLLQPDATGGPFSLSAADKWALLPAVGKKGNAVPLQTFDELLMGVGSDGSRAHSLTDACGK